MNYFKINFDNGNSLKTGFNGTLQEAEEYYLNNTFNLGVTSDVMTKAVKVEELV